MSPLSAQLDTGGSTGNGWAYTYGGFLPRPTEDFTEGAFGPFSPILPVPVDAPPPGAERAEPRREEYRVGWNLPVGQPGTEGLKLADFSTLRTLADLYSVARACIQLRKAEIRGLEWDIMPTHDAAKKMRNDHKATADFNERRVKAIKFFKHPDPDYFSWNSWLDAVLEEIFVFDALSILMRPKWSKGTGKGLLGSDLDSLALISGPTIRPLYDINGSYPRPPAPAYQQYLYGVPRTDLMSMITQRDIDEAGLKGSEMKQFRGDQLLYLPMTPRRWTPYGFPPIERALIPVMSGLQKQGYQLDFFREGSIPGLFVSPGGTNQNMTPNQIRELQDALNAIAGDPAWKHKIIVLPADSKVMPQKPAEIADQFDEIVMSQVCMAFDIQPMEIGIMPKVSTSVSPGAANQMSKASQNIHERKATKPMLTFLADIMNGVLHNVAHQDDMRFVFEGTMEEEDEETKTKRLVLQIGAGLRSIDEGREELNLQPWGLPETSDPGWATPNGWVPLVEATEARQTGWMTGNLLELPEGEPRATATLPGAAPAPGQPAQPGAAAASANGAQPRINPVMSGRPAAMASGRGNAAPSPGHSGASAAASGGKAPAKKAPVKKATAGKMRAIESELSALARHVRKGRLISSWTPRHVDNHMLARVAENVAKGMIIEDAIEVVKASRRVGLNGQIFEETPPNTPQVPMFDAAGGGARVFPPHDVDDIPVEGEGRVNRGVEVPGGVPGSTAGGEPPRWAPAEGTSSGNTFSEPRSRRDVTPEDGDDAEAPSHRGRPEHQDGGPRGSQNGTWPRGGHGTGQAGGDSPPGTVKGVVGGAPAAEVRAVMLRNFPAEAIAWVDDASWTMQLVPLHDVDFDNEDSWAAHHQPDKVRHFAAQIEAGNPPRPAIMVKTPIHHRLRIVDGHHRALAYRSLGKPVPAYVGTIEDPTDMRWSETHSSQLHQGSDPANKGEGGMVSKESVDYRPAETLEERCGTCSMFREPNSCTLVLGIIQRDDVCDEWDPITVNQETPVAAGLTVVAADTGRVLMLQRALTPGDPAAGTWEFPGGCLDLGETPLMAAEREWQEETGCTLPRGKVTGTWVSDNGVYQGFTYVVPSESSVEIFGGRDAVSNPDDPDGDSIEALAWWEPDQLMDCPAMRPELARDLDSWLGLISQR
jgi:8-oxo-dGTP pyrophosphatase MutT (NUDIX family)